MTNKNVLALVLSSSGAFQNGLLALMTTIPQISAVLVAEDVNTTLRMVDNHQPALVLLDMSPPDMQKFIKQIKEGCPGIQIIVLAEDIAQKENVEAYGADYVLIKGFSAQSLITIVENTIDYEDTPPAQADTEGVNNSDLH
ncbi:MAG: response regulator [Anaerolineales bacterium]|jgi:DNA-binding NarL/FixJ family response regulator